MTFPFKDFSFLSWGLELASHGPTGLDKVCHQPPSQSATEVSRPVGVGAGGDVQLYWADHSGAEKCGYEAFLKTSYLIEPTKMQGSPLGFGHAYQLDLSLLSFIIIHNSSCFLSQIEINQTPQCLLSFVSGKNTHYPLQGLDTSSHEGALRLMSGFQLVGGARGGRRFMQAHQVWGGGQKDTHGQWDTACLENPKEVSGMPSKMGGNEGVLLASSKAVLAHSLLNLHG